MNWINQYYWLTNTLRALFWYSNFYCIDFSIIRFDFSFQILFIVYRFAVQFFFDNVADFFLISLYVSNNFSSFYKKDMHLVSPKSFLYALMTINFFGIFIAYKIFKILFTKRHLIRYYYLISIYIFFWNRAFM